MIHPTAIIDASAKIAANVSIGPYAIVGPNVEIGEGTQIGSHSVIERDTRIGKNNRISSHVALGFDPQSTHYKNHQTFLEIGDNNIVREFATMHRGTEAGGGITKVGSGNFFMAYTHVAHDCMIGNENILANNASLAGHVELGNYIVVSAFCAAHQFVKIGDYSFLGRACKVGQDIPPYMMAVGHPAAPVALNLVGLKRRGFDEKTLRELRNAFKIVYRQSLPLAEAVSLLEKMAENSVAVAAFLAAIKNSKRGIAR